jgi:hypothetical protein
MGIVDDLVTAAAGATEPVSALLRKVKVIAARSETADLGEWVGHELLGYPDGAELPGYRGPFELQVLGNFSGPFGSGYRNAPIPPSAFPAEYRHNLFTASFYQSVSELESLAASGKGLRSEWPADALMFTQILSREGKLRLIRK